MLGVESALRHSPPFPPAMLSEDQKPTSVIDDWVTCPHRTDPVGMLDAPGCSCDRNIYACAVNGKCLMRLPVGMKRERYGDQLDGVTVCNSECKIQDQSYSRPVAAGTVSVIVTSHNYGRFLGECVASVLQQTHPPAEIVIVDDASEDETPVVASLYVGMNVRYLRVEHQNVYLTRRAGFLATSSEFLVFLDADDTLGPEYLAECMEVMQTDESIGIVTSDLQMFGVRTGRLSHHPCNIEQRNWLHSGSLVRRVALSMTEVFSDFADDPPTLTSHDDWFVWRRVLRAGWKAKTTGKASYNYRQHGTSMMAGSMRLGPYYERAALRLERITLVVPIARERYWDRLYEWIKQQPQITDVMIIDSSDSEEFRNRLKMDLAGLDVRSIRYVSRARSNGLQDQPRSGTQAYYDVQAVMPRIYRHLRDVTTEYVMIVEDDVLPPAGAVETLMMKVEDNVAGVAGVVPSAYQLGFAISGATFGSTLPITPRNDLQPIAFSGFGCLLLRRSAVMEATPFHHAGTGNYDVEFCRSIRERGWLWLLDWSVRCGHRDIPAHDAVLSGAD